MVSGENFRELTGKKRKKVGGVIFVRVETRPLILPDRGTVQELRAEESLTAVCLELCSLYGVRGSYESQG